MQPLQLTYNGVALHSLGNITIVSQSGAFSPEEFPQKETRTIQVRITTWANDTGYNFDTLYANIKSAREALQAQNKLLTWISAGETAGDTQLQRPVMVVSHDIPENPNAWGVYQQEINIAFRFEVDTSADSTTLTATVTGYANGVNYSPISLGKVHRFKNEYRNQYYSEWKNIRQRSPGTVTASGELFYGLGDTGSTNDTRLAGVIAAKNSLEAQIKAGRYITLTYGAGGALFNKSVKVESFAADIDQGPVTGVIKWSLSATYTEWPNESTYAGCDYTTALSKDVEAGRETLSFSGSITAGTEALAVSKLSAIETAVLAAYGFTAGKQVKREVSKRWVSNPDTTGVNTTNDGVAVANQEWLELSFGYSYERKTASVLGYSLTITDTDDLESGLITRTYAGSVTSSGANEEAAYNAALAKARDLGDKKHHFRVSSTEARADRQLASASATKEFIRVDFSYAYRLKGERIYLSLTTSVQDDTFGESTERISGFVVAKDMTTARAQYVEIVKQPYVDADRLIRGESTDERGEYVELGATWTDAGSGRAYMPIRLDFQLTLFKPKADDTFAIKYAVSTAHDYVGLTQRTSINGEFVADRADLLAIEADTTNPLKTFITNLGSTYGNLDGKELNYDRELVQSSNPADAEPIKVAFRLSYSKPLSTEAQVVGCQLREDITYSGIRWVSQQSPQAKDTVQNCGPTAGSRTVSGSITAATETAAMNWIKKQHGAAGIWAVWRTGETAPTERYEQPIQVSFGYEFAPLTDGSVGSNRTAGTGSNIQMVTANFTFSEIVPELPSPF